MKAAQKNYLDRRLNEVKTQLFQQLKDMYGVREHLSQEDRVTLILSEQVGVNKTKLKEMLSSNSFWAQWNEAFDFSVQEKEIARLAAPLNAARAHLDEVFLEAKDTIMLGSESEALQILKGLQELDLKGVVKKFPPVEPVRSVAGAKKPVAKKKR